MTTQRQILANRANARASTGPKTANGKSRSAQNALRHGLNIPVCRDPALAPAVDALARLIGAGNAEPHLVGPAQDIAEAQHGVRRVRAHRLRRLEDLLTDRPFQGKELEPSPVETATLPNGDLVPRKAAPEASPLEAADRLAALLVEHAREFSTLERYERRALSRRKTAIRAFDAAKMAAFVKPK